MVVAGEQHGRQRIGVCEEVSVCLRQQRFLTLQVTFGDFQELFWRQSPVELMSGPVFTAVLRHRDGIATRCQRFTECRLSGRWTAEKDDVMNQIPINPRCYLVSMRVCALPDL